MKFAYTILYVSDVSRSLSFFEEAFGLTRRFLHESGCYGELDTGATTLAFAAAGLAEDHFPGGVVPHGCDSQPAASEVAFATDDVASAFQRALKAGALPLSEPVVKPWGQTVAYVRDPDGHLVELCTPMG
jgi:catechol 2,3-dioxygenase-like lactoylglutathione lyase family enzyme